jgi:hypothetical protein
MLQANAASVLRALMLKDMEIKQPPPVEIITYKAEEGSEGLFKAAAIARAENEKKEKEHQRRHHDLHHRRLVI